MWYGAMRDEVAMYDGLRNSYRSRWKPMGLFGKLRRS